MMLTKCLPLLIPLFDSMLRPCLFPAKHETATARNGAPERLVAQRANALLRTEVCTLAVWQRFRKVLCIVAISASLATAAIGATAAQIAGPIASPAMNAQNDPFAKLVDEAAHRIGIPAAWIRAVMQVESNGNPIAVSPKGAMGLMQIMPKTWADLRARYGLGADPFDPHDNILAGAAYLHELYERFGEGGFLAAYNAGPTGFENYLAGIRPLRDETVNYLAKLQRLIPTLQIGGKMNAIVRVTAWRQATLFPTPSTAPPSPLNSSPSHSPSTSSPPASFALTPQSSGMFVAIRTPPQ